MTNLKIKAPQIIWICFGVLSLFTHIIFNGQELTGHFNGLFKFADLVFDAALLYWGGFFTRENPEQPRIKPVSHFNIDD